MKIALYGLWHVHAPQYYRTAAEYGEVIGVYEENPDFRAAFCEKFPVPVFETPEDLLKSDADAVIVCSSSDTHADAMVAIAKAGKDIFTEKVLALTEADCLRVAEAVRLRMGPIRVCTVLVVLVPEMVERTARNTASTTAAISKMRRRLEKNCFFKGSPRFGLAEDGDAELS